MTGGLTPRPELSPDELAAIVVAARELMREVTPVAIDQVPVWRFSGRWFNGDRFADRRPHSLN